MLFRSVLLMILAIGLASCSDADVKVSDGDRDGEADSDGDALPDGDGLPGCDETSGCCEDGVAVNNGAPCADDGQACTEDYCLNGACVHPVLSGYCQIGDQCLKTGAVNPDNECEECDAGLNREGWTPLSGTPCADDGLACTEDACDAGECAHPPVDGYCVLEAECVTAGTTRERNDCLVCDPSVDALTWTPLSDVPCADDGLTCTADVCGEGVCGHPPLEGYCAIGDACFVAGDANPENVCLACDPSVDATSWSPQSEVACADDGVPCTDDVCQAGVCEHPVSAGFCLIGGGCVADKTLSETDACRICDVATNQNDWSPADGVSCPDDGISCTADVCMAGDCTHPAQPGFCLIDGVCVTNGTMSETEACRICDAEANPAGWSPAEGRACADDFLPCTTDLCHAGDCVHALQAEWCLIGGICVEEGETSATQECRVCDPESNPVGWTSANNAPCADDGDSCTQDICQSGVCQHLLQENSCRIGGECYASGETNPGNVCQSCQPSIVTNAWSNRTGSCEVDGIVCTAGTCQSGVCQETAITEGYCRIGGVCYTNGAGNPSNDCQRCTSTLNQQAWSAKPNGAACDDGDPCTPTDTCQSEACTGSGYIANDCTDYTKCGPSPSECHDCGDCAGPDQVCWSCDSSVQSCWAGEGIDTGVCAPNAGGDCGDTSGLQAGSPWAMRGGCPTHQGRSAYRGPTRPILKWKYQIEGIIQSSAAIGADEMIYVGSVSGNFFSFKPNGSVYWQVSSLGPIWGSPTLGSNSSIYFADNSGYLNAYDPFGRLLWRFSTNGDSASSPNIDGDGNVYIGSYDGHLYVVNGSGNEIRRFDTGGLVSDSPALLADGTAYFGAFTSNKFFSITPAGDQRWAFETGGGINASPAIGADGTVYFGSEDKFLYALSPDGDLKWKFGAGDKISWSAPSIGLDGTVYFGAWDGFMYALNPDGSLKWKAAVGAVSSGPVADADGNLYVGTRADQFVSLTPDGQVRWQFPFTGSASSSAAIAPDGTLYFGASDGYFYALQDCAPNSHWCGAGKWYTCNGAGTALAGEPADCPGGCDWGVCMQKRSLWCKGSFLGKVLVPDSETLRISRPHMTLEAWVKTDSGTPSQIFAKGAWASSNVNYVLSAWGSGGVCNISFGVNHDGTNYSWRATKNSATTGSWTHVAAVLDDDAQEARTYWNGERLTDFTLSPPSWPAGLSLPVHGELQIAPGSADTFIDELRISDIPRYTASFTPSKRFEPDGHTRLLLHLDEGSGTTAHDSSPYENHGEISGTTTWSADVPAR